VFRVCFVSLVSETAEVELRNGNECKPLPGWPCAASANSLSRLALERS